MLTTRGIVTASAITLVVVVAAAFVIGTETHGAVRMFIESMGALLGFLLGVASVQLVKRRRPAKG